MRRFVVLLILLSGLLLTSVGMAVAEYNIEELQAAINASGGQWIAGETSMSVLTIEEMQKKLGWSAHPITGKPFSPPVHWDLDDVPQLLDWRNINSKNYVTPIRDQADCGSCYIFSGVGAVECAWAIALDMDNPNIDLSEQFILSCLSKNGCDGGFMAETLDDINIFGVPDEACFPYAAYELPCGQACDNWPLRTVGIEDYDVVLNKEAIEPEDIAAIVNALQIGPVTVGFDVYEDFMYYTWGIYHRTPGSMYMGGHGVVIIGYSIPDQYWICKNSWGYGWGESGFFRIGWGESGLGYETLLPHTPPCTGEALYITPLTPGDGFIRYDTAAVPINIRVWNDCKRGVSGATVTAAINGTPFQFFDDGAHGDMGANDGVFTATIAEGAYPIGTDVTIEIDAQLEGLSPAHLTIKGKFKYPATILLWSDGAPPESETFYKSLLDSIGISYDIWRTGVNGPVIPSVLTKAPVILWFAGPSTGSLNSAGRDALEQALDAGGNLMVSGQDLLQQVMVDFPQFVKQYLHVQNYVSDTKTTGVAGVAGDPLTDGLSCDLTYPFENWADTIFPGAGATGIFKNDFNKWSALRYPAQYKGDSHQVVYLAFPIEAMPNDIALTFFTRSIQWLLKDECFDMDGDGFGVGGQCSGPQDCNDGDPNVNPGAAEICNDGIDNNCNGLTDSEDPACQSVDDDSGDDDSGDDDSAADDDSGDDDSAVNDDDAADDDITDDDAADDDSGDYNLDDDAADDDLDDDSTNEEEAASSSESGCGC